MAIFGVEGMRIFAVYRANNPGSKTSDMTYTYNVTNGLDEALREGGHRRGFYWAGNDVWEKDMRDVDVGGLDNVYADNVDLFFIITHGGHFDGVTQLVYNTKVDDWRSYQTEWYFGDTNEMEWAMIYGCKTIDRNNPIHLWQVFQGLHIFCGSSGSMYDSITTDEVGEDIGENLTDGQTISYSWIDGVSDWAVDNNPMLVSAERFETYNEGNYDWPNTTLNRDHFWRGGYVSPDIPVNDRFWLAYRWAEG